MKKILRNNQVIITALAIMIAIAGYLNFSNKSSKNIGMSGEFYEAKKDVISTKEPKETEGAQAKSEENDIEEVINSKVEEHEVADNSEGDNIGEAVLVNSNISLDYFYTVKLNREQNRAKNKEELIKVAENNELSDKEKEIAVNKIIELTANSERERMLLR